MLGFSPWPGLAGPAGTSGTCRGLQASVRPSVRPSEEEDAGCWAGLRTLRCWKQSVVSHSTTYACLSSGAFRQWLPPVRTRICCRPPGRA